MRKKKQEDRKQLLMRYRIDDKGRVSFIDPCCDDIPAELFGNVMSAFSEIEKKWNEGVDKRSFRTVVTGFSNSKNINDDKT